MASSSPSAPTPADSGFATPAAAAISLAMAATVAAVMSLAVSSLNAARSDLERTQGEYDLAGARLAAAQVLLQSANTSRVRWTLTTETGPVEVLAEPEGAKLPIREAATPSLARLLGVTDPASLTTAVEGLSGQPDMRIADLAALDASPLWRRCAASFVSAHGSGKALPTDRPAPPRPGPINWRLGQLWRLRLTDARGWTDDSIIRFTGAPSHPVAVAARQFTHSGPLGNTCDLTAQDAPAA